MNKLILSSMVLLVLPLGGCSSCKKDQPAETKVLTSPLPSVPIAAASKQAVSRSIRRATLTEPMEEILKVAEEMQRRAMGRVAMKAPALLMKNKIDALPAKNFPATFRTFLDHVRDRLKILQSSQNLRRDFNSLVDACQGCHRVYALRAIPPTKKLRVPLRDDAGVKPKR